ncbi:4-hydroxythreonine-4-phosphate dehydrogenase PdxA [Bacteroidales bacterium OttesenSCG-928-I14]|nr:4-hydroxythreonine-4-phosphate dehydrogenase PdxA [Bacteroidales bacterium OttesenSCG-928-I14]
MIKVGISHGDINGVSYELIIKTFDDIRMYDFCIPVLYGSAKALAYHRKALDLNTINTSNISSAKDAAPNRLNIVNCTSDEITVDLSKPTKESEKYAEQAFEMGIKDLNEGLIDVLVSAPANLDDIAILEKNSGVKTSGLKILVKDSFRIALATGKMPISEVASKITTEQLTQQLRVLNEVLVKDFMVVAPRIAVLSLNPGMGLQEKEEGKEEIDIIAPAIQAANEAGVCCFGPYAADSFFGTETYMSFDATLAMYYDQGLVPFRSIAYEEGVSYVANLPIISTSPDLGASYDNAGKNQTPTDSFRNAIYLAIDIFNSRNTYLDITKNPLRKQYVSKGSDNEKLDLTKEE